MPSFARELEQTLHNALAEASGRRHEYATLEHLLLALIEASSFAFTRAISPSRIWIRACSSSTDKGSRSCFVSRVSGSSGLSGNRSSRSMRAKLTLAFPKSISRRGFAMNGTGGWQRCRRR